MRSILRAVLALLVPYLISAQIYVEVVPDADGGNPNLAVSGKDRVRTSDVDLDAFQLTESGVKNILAGMRLILWKRVQQINFHRASEYGYRNLHVTLKPKSSRIVRTNERVVKNRKRTYRNQGETPKLLKVTLDREVTESMSTKWFNAQDISAGDNINYVMGSNGLVLSSKYGRDGFGNSRPVIMEAESDDEVVQPGETVGVELQVRETTLEVRIDYEATLDGDISFGYFCGLITGYCLKHERLDINEYFLKSGQSPVLQSYEIVKFTYYHDPQVKLLANRSPARFDIQEEELNEVKPTKRTWHQ